MSAAAQPLPRVPMPVEPNERLLELYMIERPWTPDEWAEWAEIMGDKL